MNDKYYITTPIYYVNDVPHVGHAYTTLAADIIARYWKEKKGEKNVFFLTGTDEHGQKVAQAAEEKKLSPKEFADKVSPRFKKTWELLNIKPDYFIRTTDPKHKKIVTSLLQKIYDNGYIRPGTYEGLYCVGCEKFLTETELVDKKCPLHPNRKPVYQKEENYFLKLKDLSKKVLKKIKDNEYQILPEKRRHEVLSRLERGVEDISISRAGVSWGIPVPWDKKQTIYVWVDALINYYSATKFLEGKEKFWPAELHVIGKDILWFHTVIWQALLIAAEIDLPKTIFAHGFFTIDGQKISKSLGNTIAPEELVKKYGVDGARYLVASALTFGEDGNISFSRFDEKYNADLANGLGNLVARVAKLCELSKTEFGDVNISKFSNKTVAYLLSFSIDRALESIWSKIGELDKKIDENKLWENTSKKKEILTEVVGGIRQIAFDLKSFLPETAEKIEKQFKGPKIESGKPLFPRLK